MDVQILNNAQSTSPATVNGKSFWRKFDNEVVLAFRVGLEKTSKSKTGKCHTSSHI